MGGGTGGGYASNGGRLNENLDEVAKMFPRTPSGFFGKPRGGKSRVRLIASDNPEESAKQFFAIASKGGKITPILFEGGSKSRKSKGFKASFDGSHFISVRPVTSSKGSPAIQISFKDGSGQTQKIHFEKKEK